MTTEGSGTDAGAMSAQRLRDALRTAGVAEVEITTRRRGEYASDASLYRVPPLAVAFPRSATDVEAALGVCRHLGVPLTSRGGGTSIAGNAVGPGLVLDFTRHMNRVHTIDPESRTAVVEPGVVLSDLQRAAAGHGLRFGPDPSTHNRCTIGGMIGNNACGSRALGHGRTIDNVLELDMLTGTGERMLAGRAPRRDDSVTSQALHRLVDSSLAVLRTEFGRFGRQVSGYSLEHLLPERGTDLARALVGTEGTCGVLLGATVRLVRVPAASVLVVLGYEDMPAAADDVPGILEHAPVALEGMDTRITDVVRQRHGGAGIPELPSGGGWLLVELGGDHSHELEEAATEVVRRSAAIGSSVITDPAAASEVWRIREDGAGLSGRTPAGDSAHAGWEDAAVPPANLGAYLREFEELLRSHGLTGVPYGHFGDGCVHIRIDFPFGAEHGTRTFRTFLEEAATLVAAHGGSMSGEHGDGRARSELLPRMYSRAAIDLFAAFKAILDPDDVLNPGVIVRPHPPEADLRVASAPPLTEGLGFGYPDDGDDFSRAVHRCTGIGKCRADSTATGGVMCPSYLATGDEKDSTRGRARVLQEMIDGSLVRAGWRSPEVHESLDLCLSCKACASECPTGIDMATYKAEALHQTYRRRLRPATHYSLGWLPRAARLASKAPALANRAMANRALSRLAMRVGGIDTRRSLPGFAPRTFRKWFTARPDSPADGDPVLLWVDTFTNHFSPEVGIAAVRVLERAGYTVRFSEPRQCCALTWISTGQLDAARRILRRTVTSLAEQADVDVPIVALEPSCAAVLRKDGRDLLGHGDAAAAEVSERTRTLAELLSTRDGWRPPDLTGHEIVAQPHCHHNAVLGWQPDRRILSEANARVRAVGGCCGLAGNFGFERGHYDVSRAVAETALLPALRDASPDTTVLADGFSCRTQIDEFAGRDGEHLAQLLERGGPCE